MDGLFAYVWLSLPLSQSTMVGVGKRYQMETSHPNVHFFSPLLWGKLFLERKERSAGRLGCEWGVFFSFQQHRTLSLYWMYSYEYGTKTPLLVLFYLTSLSDFEVYNTIMIWT